MAADGGLEDREWAGGEFICWGDGSATAMLRKRWTASKVVSKANRAHTFFQLGDFVFSVAGERLVVCTLDATQDVGGHAREFVARLCEQLPGNDS